MKKLPSRRDALKGQRSPGAIFMVVASLVCLFDCCPSYISQKVFAEQP